MTTGVKYLSQAEASAIDVELFNECGYSVDQLMELAGLSVACVIQKVYPAPSLGGGRASVLVLCGPGNNGGDGLVCARHLRLFGYEPQVYYPRAPKETLYQRLLQQCEGADVRVLKQLPETSASLDDQFDLLVDAIFGFSFRPPIRPDWLPAFSLLRNSTRPLLAIDIPSGWDVDGAEVAKDGLQPNVLVSLTAPKLCARHLLPGARHFLGGRFVPPRFAAKHGLCLPVFANADQFLELCSSKPPSQ